MTHVALTTIVVDDYDRAIGHYVAGLGFELTEDTPLPDGKRWVVVSSPDRRGTALLLAPAADEAQRAAIGRQTGGRVGFFLHTRDIAAERERMVAAGIRFLEPTRHEVYGSVAVFEDAYGNRWDLIEPAHHPTTDAGGHRWLSVPGADVDERDAGLTFGAGPRTDWFRDVRTATATANAPVAVVGDTTPVIVTCHVRATLRATFDAAGLFVHHDDEHWVKFALERSPEGRPTIVTVRTDGWSDDCNHVDLGGLELDSADCRMRVAVDDRSVAMHVHDPVDDRWHLVRYGASPSPVPPTVGLIVQSPTGDGAVGTFADLRVEHGSVADLRDGS